MVIKITNPTPMNLITTFLISERVRYFTESLGGKYSNKELEDHDQRLLAKVREITSDRIKHRFNGFGGVLGFTQTDLLSLLPLQENN